MSKYGADYTSNNGKGIVRADGFVIGSVAKAPAVVLSGTFTFNPVSLTTGAFAESDVELTGVALGDSVTLYPPYDTQGIIYQASVQAADNITISLTSCNSGTVDLASGTWGYVVTRRV
jgi:hypothetical protein